MISRRTWYSTSDVLYQDLRAQSTRLVRATTPHFFFRNIITSSHYHHLFPKTITTILDNIVEVNKLDAENNSRALNEAELIYGDFDDASLM